MAITAITYTQTGLPNQNGKGTVTIIRATYPASTASASLNVGNISSFDLVEVRAQGTAASLVGLIEIKASRTTSNVGQCSILVGNVDGSTGSASTVPFEVRIYRN